MGLLNWACLGAAYGVGIVFARGNVFEAAGALFGWAIFPGLFLLRTKGRPGPRPPYHLWTVAFALFAMFGQYYTRTH